MLMPLIGLLSDIVTVLSGAACIYVAYTQLVSKKGPKDERSDDDDEGESG